VIQKIFIWTSPLPLLLFWGLTFYVNQYEGWDQRSAGILLLGPVLLSLLMAVMGVILIVRARKQKTPVANLWFSTLMAGSLVLFLLVKGVAFELTKSFG
jgi:hypothetical protein